MLKRYKLSEQLVLTSHWTIRWTIGCFKKAKPGDAWSHDKSKLAWPGWLGIWLSGDKGHWLSIGQLVVETYLVDCRKGHERYSRSYVSAIAETCQRGTVEQNCRTELSNIAVEQRGLNARVVGAATWLFCCCDGCRRVVVATVVFARQRLLIVSLQSSMTFDHDDRCCIIAESCGARIAIVLR
jgi:hypothetical protein